MVSSSKIVVNLLEPPNKNWVYRTEKPEVNLCWIPWERYHWLATVDA